MSRLRTNTLAMIGSFLSQAIFVFLQMKILTHWMPREEFGLFSAVFAAGALLSGLAELGFPVVLVRYGAKFEAEGRPNAVLGLVTLALRFWGGAMLVVGGLLAAAAALRLLPGLDRPGVTPGLVLLGFAAVASFSLRSIVMTAFQGIRRMLPAMGMDLVYGLAVTGLYLAFRERLDAARVFGCLLAASAGVGLAGFAWFRRVYRGVPGGERPGTRQLMSEIQGFWGGAFVTGLVALAMENGDRLAIAALAPFGVVAVYHVAGRIGLFARKILFIPQQVAHPELTFKWEQGQVEGVRADLRLFAKLEWAVGLLVCVGVVLGARVGVRLASTGEYSGAVPALIALAGSLPILCLGAPLTTFLRASGRIWVSVTSELVWLGGYLVTGALLFRRFGLAGFASGQIFAAAVALLYTVAALKRLRLPCPSIRFLLAHGVGTFLIWGGAAGLVRAHPIDSLPVALAGALAFALVMNVALAWARYLTPAEEARLLGFLGGGTWARAGQWLLTWPRGGR